MQLALIVCNRSECRSNFLIELLEGNEWKYFPTSEKKSCSVLNKINVCVEFLHGYKHCDKLLFQNVRS